MITLNDVQDKLLSLDEAREAIAPLETMGEAEFSMGDGSIRFELPDGWNTELDNRDGTEVTDAKVVIDDEEYALTKDAALAASSLVGLSRRCMSVTPGHLAEPYMNYWYAQEGGYQAWSKNLKLIHRPEDTGGVGVAFCRSAMTAFSMTRILDETVESIQRRYGANTPIYVDKRMEVSIRGVRMRLLVPETERSMKSKYASDEGNDPWSAGVAIQSSLTGDLPLQASGFMLRYVCTNGATTEHSASATHRRKRSEELEEVYQWVGAEVDHILESVEDELLGVDALNSIKFSAGDLPETMAQIFTQFRVPVSAREQITSEMIESEDISAYGLMQAVTQSANDASLSHAEIARLWSVGGSIPHVLSGRCPQCHRLPV